MKTGFAIALLELAMLCTSALAQENTASSAYEKSLEHQMGTVWLPG